MNQRAVDFWDLEVSYETEPAAIALERLVSGINALKERGELGDESITLVLKVCDFHKYPRKSQALLWGHVVLGVTSEQTYQTLPMVCSRLVDYLSKTDEREWFLGEFGDAIQIELALKLTTLFKRFGDGNRAGQVSSYPCWSDPVVHMFKVDSTFAKGEWLELFELAKKSSPNFELDECTPEFFAAISEQDYRNFKPRALMSGSYRDKLLLWILSVAFPKQGGARKGIATPESLRKSLSEELGSSDKRLLEICIAIQHMAKLDGSALPQRILDMINSVGMTHVRLLLWRVASQYVENCKEPYLAETLKYQYERDCLQSTDGATKDLLGTDKKLFSTPNPISSKLFGSRTLKLSAATTKLVASSAAARMTHLFSQSREKDDELKKRIVKILDAYFSDIGQMHGAMQKIAQFGMSLQSSLPYVMRDYIQDIEDNSTFKIEPKIVETLISSDNPKVANELSSYDPEPFALGSIGQIHRAVLKSGDEVCLKLRYPDVSKQVRTDFRNIAVFTPILKALFPKQPVKRLLKAWETLVQIEVDLAVEAANYKRVSEYLADLDIEVPKIYDELSTSSCLVASFVDGISIEEFSKTANQEERDRVGEQIWRAQYRILKNGFWRGDTVSSNYMVRDGNLVLVDMGYMVDAHETQAYDLHVPYNMLMLDKDIEGLSKLFYDKSWGDESASEKTAKVCVGVLGRPLQGPFSFTSTFIAESQNAILSLATTVALPTGSEFLFTYYVSLFATLAKIEAKADWGQLFREELSL